MTEGGIAGRCESYQRPRMTTLSVIIEFVGRASARHDFDPRHDFDHREAVG
jgi:hypothetical protein